ncbi:unnamed protein product [Somion occarium]|uniref:F-box domain-containing protein n=1 Tax=Somion occarium TaxID=3059160 RepID=A0ABP1DMY2_9APHY
MSDPRCSPSELNGVKSDPLAASTLTRSSKRHADVVESEISSIQNDSGRHLKRLRLDGEGVVAHSLPDDGQLRSHSSASAVTFKRARDEDILERDISLAGVDDKGSSKQTSSSHAVDSNAESGSSAACDTNVVGRSKRPISSVYKTGSQDSSTDLADQDKDRATKRIRLQEEDVLAGSIESNAKTLLLPVELHDLILEQLWENTNFECTDSTTFRACARTCSVWRAAARPHIFRFVHINRRSKLLQLSKLIHDDPSIASWIRKVRLEGVPPWNTESHSKEAVLDESLDRWILDFPATFNTPLTNVRILEIMYLCQSSVTLKDQRAFARWIPQLKELQSVQELNVLHGQMSPNTITALIRAFGRLVKLGLCEVNFGESNKALVQRKYPVESPGNNSTTTSTKAVRIHRTWVKPVPYPLLHPHPSLQSLFLGNEFLSDINLKLETLRRCLKSDDLSRTLSSLYIGTLIPSEYLCKFITRLGPSSMLESLKIPLRDVLQLAVSLGKAVSNLHNLKTLCIYTPFLNSEQSDVIRHFLVLLDASHLRRLSIMIEIGEPFEDVEVVDETVASEKFESLQEFVIEIVEKGDWTMEEVQDGIKALFPLMEKKGILRVERWIAPYLYRVATHPSPPWTIIDPYY